jgi:UDP-2,3-diacylglucosamine pyrophosphatase LpxH
MGLAKRVSRTSRRFTGRMDPENGAEAAALREFARTCLSRGETQVVICGHAHSPTCEHYPTPNGPGLYINTGDWIYHRSYVEWDGEEFRLVCPRPCPAPTR